MPDWDAHTQRDADWTVEHLRRIEGGTVTKVGVAIENMNEGLDAKPWWEVFPILLITMPDGTKYQCAVLQDPEGNGPGHFDIAKDES